MNNNEVIIIIQYLTLLELDIDKTITHQNIQSQFRKLSHIYHPDIANERYSDGKKFIELQQAKEYLISNIEYLNIMIRNGFRTNYDIKDELRKQREETARKEAERKAKEEAERKAAEEARKRAEEERIRKEEQRRKEEERQRTLREKKEIENTLNNLLKSLDKDIYYDKEYNYIISLINDFISRLYNRSYYKEEYETLMKEISKVKTKKYYEKVKKIKKIAFHLASSITALIILIVLSINLIIPSIKYNKALKNIENRDYLSAGEILNTIKDFKDADLQYSLLDVYKNLDNNNYEKAINIIKENSGNVYLNYNTDGGYLDGNLDDSSSLQLKESKKNGYAFSYYEVEKYEVNTEDELFLKVMLKAIYEIEQYDIEFILNDGILGNNDISTYDIETSDIELPIPYKNGYDFVGWYNSDGNQIDIIRKGSYGNICLIAKYEPKIYTINYNLNGGTNNENNVFEYNIESNDIHIKNPIKDGYTFLGWYGNGITELNKNYIITSGNTGNIELTAHWQANDYKIVYDLNGGTNNESNPSGYIMDSGNIIIYQANKLGYTFTGWTTPEDNRLRENFVINDGTYGNINLIANYVPNNYTISFDVNGGKELLNNKVIVEFDANYILSIPVRESYEFLGWTNENGEIFLNEYKHIVDSDIELVAKWKPIEYTIEYNLNGGVNHIENPSIYTTEKEITLKYPTKTGYTFIGWTSYINSQPVKDYNVSINNYGNLKLTANYKANTYNIIYDVNTGDALLNNKQIVFYDSEFKTIVPTKTGYDFVGWYLNNEKFDLEKWDLLNNITLKAKWSPKRYLINIIDEVSNQFEVEYDSIFIINNQLKENYIFKGYYSEPYGKGKKYTDEYGKSLNIYKNIEGINLYPYYQYSVEFISNGGSEVSKLIYDENVFLNSNIISTKVERTFEGWYTDINLTSKFVKVIGNVKVYAKWLEETDTSLFEYEVLDNLKITKYIGTLEEIIIPSHIGGIEVKELSSYLFKDNQNVKKIEFPYGLNKIPDYICYGCINLENIIIPNTIVEIGNYSFYNCANLNTFVIPDKVTTIGEYSFYECKSLEMIKIPTMTNNVGDCAFFNCYNLTSISIPNIDVLVNYVNIDSLEELIINGGTRIAPEMFRDCLNLKNINILNGVSTIGEYAFQCCLNLNKVEISSNVTDIGDGAFFDCKSLTNITIPESVTNIGNDVFRGCTSLTNITIPESVTNIGESPFYYCSSLTNVYYNGSIEDWCNIVFSNYDSNPMYCAEHLYMLDENNEYKEVTEITIPNSITSIGDNQFCGFDNITSITIPENVTSMGKYAFSNCDNLTSITIPESVTSMGKYAFSNCDNLTSITIPESVTSIGSFTFFNCDNLTSITIPDSITRIDSYAFSDCTSLTNITISEGVKSIGEYAFNNCISLANIKVPDSVNEIGQYAFYNCENLESITVPFVGKNASGNNVTHFGYIFGAKNYEYNDYYVPDQLKEVIITTTNKIKDNAFYKCSNLTNIEIPNSVTYIGYNVFYGCSRLTKIVTPNVFDNYSGFANFGYIFGSRDKSNNPSYIPDSLKEIVITSGKSIGEFTFDNCNSLEKITIPDSVKSIESWAFSGCTSLIDVYYDGKVEDWCQIAFKSAGSNPMYYGKNIYMIDDNNCYYEVKEIEIRDKITSIGNFTFFGFENLKSIEIPESVTSIGSYVFAGCTSLTSVIIPEEITNIGEEAFQGCINLKYNIYENALYLGNEYNLYLALIRRINVDIKDCIINSNTKIIAPNAFYDCTNFASVEIPSSVKSIGDYAFSKCENLTSVTISEGVKNIGECAFYNCISLVNIKVPDSVNEIGQYAFLGCTKLESITVPFVGNKLNGTKNTHFTYIFGSIPSSLKEVIIDGCEIINESAFSGCVNLTNIIISEGVTAIGSGAFSGCSQLTSITIPDSITSINSNAFSGCTSLKYNLYDNVGYLGNEYNPYLALVDVFYTTKYCTVNPSTKVIADWAFSKCENLISITISEGVKSIGDYAFYNCTNLKGITIPEGVTSIGDYAFSGCSNLTSIVIPQGVIQIGRNAFENCTRLTSITILEGITSIGEYTFSDCESLTNIIIPKSVTSIGDYAFYGCKDLTNIIIPENVTTIGDYVFYYCESLTSITFSEGVKSIGDYAFYNCVSLTSITIPESFTSIGNYAFRHCMGLKSIIIPKNVKYIGENAFYECYGITIYCEFEAKPTEWNNDWYGYGKVVWGYIE